MISRPEESLRWSVPARADVGQTNHRSQISSAPSWRIAVDVFLGLKPQADSFRPVGAEIKISGSSSRLARTTRFPLGRFGNRLRGRDRSVTLFR